MTNPPISVPALFDPKEFVNLPVLEKDEMLPAERRLSVFFRWWWLPLAVVVVAAIALKLGWLGFHPEDQAYKDCH